MNFDEWDQCDQDAAENQYRRVFRSSAKVLDVGGSKTKRKLKPKPVTRYNVEEHIDYCPAPKTYIVRVGRKGLRVYKGGFKTIEAAREYRDTKLVGFVKAPIPHHPTKNHTPAMFVK